MTIRENKPLEFTKRRGYTGTIRKVWYDGRFIGIIGKETELVEVGIMSIEGRKPNEQTWMCIPDPDQFKETCPIGTTIGFGATRNEAIMDAIFAEKEEESDYYWVRAY